MKNYKLAILFFTLTAIILSAACSNSPKINNSNPNVTTRQADGTAKDTVPQSAENTSELTANTTPENTVQTSKPIDPAKVKPNEVGKIMVVMFHNFVAEYKTGDKYYTTTFDNGCNVS